MSTTTYSDAPPPLGRRYTVGGVRLMLDHAGTGGPPVVFLSGGTACALNYLMLHRRVSAFTTSVVYDRGGIGWSEPVAFPRTCAEVAQELHDLLRVAGIAGPYVLVAHSYSGLLARRFTQMFPEAVAGVVGMEPLPEFWDESMPEQFHLSQTVKADAAVFLQDMPEEMRATIRSLLDDMLAGWPEGPRATLTAWHLDQDTMRAAARERSNLAGLPAEIRAAGPVPDRPLITLTGLQPDPGMQTFMSAEALDELTGAKRAMFDRLAASVRDGEHRVLDYTSHGGMHTEGADDVIQAIRDMVAKTRP
ncbi:alpha/beta fold hydrolase [Nonomuraea typhae]|uniref:alpha/beta fold hydrolase n=1 Tax=Nonomuraea typhae TaxID=2603600 RepID=UPI0012F86AAC|nr:alpha/beta hydrolase [Nonomuraea typhae]